MPNWVPILKKIFRSIIVLTICSYILLIISPYAWKYLYDQDTLNALSWNGYGSVISTQGAIPWIFVFAYLILSVGLLSFKTWARTGFTILTLGVGLLAPLWGLAVMAGLDGILSYYMVLGDGMLLVMMYFTSISNEFSKA